MGPKRNPMSGKCGMELSKNGDHASCSNCGEGYHFGDCCGLKAETWRERGQADKDKWKRVQCRPLRKATASISNHVWMRALNRRTRKRLMRLAAQGLQKRT